jgi:hypothetical protein
VSATLVRIGRAVMAAAALVWLLASCSQAPRPVRFVPEGRPQRTIPTFSTGEATNRTDARLAWTSHGPVPVTVAVYSNNLVDNRYVTGVQTISATTLGTPFSNITAPRFYGVEVGAHF